MRNQCWCVHSSCGGDHAGSREEGAAGHFGGLNRRGPLHSPSRVAPGAFLSPTPPTTHTHLPPPANSPAHGVLPRAALVPLGIDWHTSTHPSPALRASFEVSTGCQLLSMAFNRHQSYFTAARRTAPAVNSTCSTTLPLLCYSGFRWPS